MVFLSTASLFPAFLAFTVAVATPLQARTDCHPNFSGRAVSIYSADGTLEWGQGTAEVGRALAYQAPSSDHGEFKTEFTGDADSTYYIKAADIPANNLYLSQGPRSNILAWTDSPTPRHSITCSSCANADASTFHGVYASGCTIKNPNGLCIKDSVAAGSVGEFIRFFDCEDVPEEKWSFVLA
ncbi:hypothetical protein DL96DRAFT_1586843 [Flagelloscypha sp. PMI_526]|nr:hypothetical protein DL96DRAFT_1586843 [Flagelloscypha sp. PMI_526]